MFIILFIIYIFVCSNVLTQFQSKLNSISKVIEVYFFVYTSGIADPSKLGMNKVKSEYELSTSVAM